VTATSRFAQEVRVWDDESRRQHDEGLRAGRELLTHLGVGDVGDQDRLLAIPGFERLLVRWAIEFPCNVEWYDKKIPVQQLYYDISRVLATVLGVAIVVGTTALVFWKKDVTTAQVGVLAAGIFGVLQIVAAGGDPKARLGGFRKARADLKEAMFTFAETWAERVLDPAGPTRPTPDFVMALLQEIRAGRKISRDERETFFGTFKSPTEILGAANAAVEAVRGRRAELAATSKDAKATEASQEQAALTRIKELRGKLAEATAQKEALEDKKVRLKARQAATAALEGLQSQIEDVETECFKTRRLLALAANGDAAPSL